VRRLNAAIWRRLNVDGGDLTAAALGCQEAGRRSLTLMFVVSFALARPPPRDRSDIFKVADIKSVRLAALPASPVPSGCPRRPLYQAHSLFRACLPPPPPPPNGLTRWQERQLEAAS
jgi:hypothetical protein